MPCYHTQLGNILVSGEDTLFGLESEGGGEVSRDSVAQVWGGVDHGGGGEGRGSPWIGAHVQLYARPPAYLTGTPTYLLAGSLHHFTFACVCVWCECSGTALCAAPLPTS